ncbi:MAG: OmpH family outer membrane protein [Candidatus Omnitrophota bacterium]
MKKAVTTVALILVSVFAFSGAAVYAADKPYAFVNAAKLFDEYQKTKDNDAVLQQEGQAKEKERNVIVEDIRKMKDEIELLSDEAKKTKQETMNQRIRDLQDFDMKTRQELMQKRQTIVEEIFAEIDQVVQKYGKEKNLDYIINDRAVLYQNEAYNITPVILEELNKNYQQKKK